MIGFAVPSSYLPFSSFSFQCWFSLFLVNLFCHHLIFTFSSSLFCSLSGLFSEPGSSYSFFLLHIFSLVHLLLYLFHLLCFVYLIFPTSIFFALFIFFALCIFFALTNFSFALFFFLCHVHSFSSLHDSVMFFLHFGYLLLHLVFSCFFSS